MKHINKKIIIVGVTAALCFGAFVSFAQTPSRPDSRQELRDRAQNTREESREKRQEVRQEVRTNVRNTREDIQAKREDLKKQLEAKRDEAKKRLEALREEAKEKRTAKRDELKKRLEQVKDQRKKERAVKLDEQMNRLNERWTTHFTNALNRLEEILAKVQIRADKAASLGKDVSAARTAVDAAKNAITIARAAVETQAQKSYTVTFTSEEELRNVFKQAKEQLHKDLKELRDGAVKAAREAVHQAARALSGIARIDDEPEPTSTDQ